WPPRFKTERQVNRLIPLKNDCSMRAKIVAGPGGGCPSDGLRRTTTEFVDRGSGAPAGSAAISRGENRCCFAGRLRISPFGPIRRWILEVGHLRPIQARRCPHAIGPRDLGQSTRLPATPVGNRKGHPISTTIRG